MSGKAGPRGKGAGSKISGINLAQRSPPAPSAPPPIGEDKLRETQRTRADEAQIKRHLAVVLAAKIQ